MKRLIITLFVFSFVFVGCYNTGTTIDKGGCIDGSVAHSGMWIDGQPSE